MPKHENRNSAGADLLYGVAAIAAHMGLTERQVRHLMAEHSFPSFKIGATVCSNRSTIDEWSRTLESSSTDLENPRVTSKDDRIRACKEQKNDRRREG